MENTRFQKLYELAKDIELKQLKNEYERLKEIDNSFDSFEDYKAQQEVHEEYLKKNRSPEQQKKIDDSYISKDIIEKDNFKINMCLFHFRHIDPIKLDEDYKIIPSEEKEIYQYMCSVSYEEQDGVYKINGLFGGIETDEHLARDKYNALKNQITKMNEEELMNKIEEELNKK